MKEEVTSDDLFFKMGPIGNFGFFSLNGLTVKKQILLDIGLFNPTLRLSQDSHICVKLAAKYKLVAGSIDEPVALYGLHQDNRSQFNNKIQETRPYLFYDLYKWARKEDLEKHKIHLLWQCFYEYYLLVNQPSRSDQRKLLSGEASSTKTTSPVSGCINAVYIAFDRNFSALYTAITTETLNI
ncbi:hypothetical protein OAB20_06925 [Winogradskyella sp.]|nr:hypothetical protein [Winogradskyella sp.]